MVLVAVTVSDRLLDAVHRQLLKSDLVSGLLIWHIAAIISRCSRDYLH